MIGLDQTPKREWHCRLCVKHTRELWPWDIELRDLLQENYCWSCAFWLNIQRRRDFHKRLIIKNTVYVAGGLHTGTPKKFLGYGGANCTIEILHSGEIIRTNSLWCNGRLPTHFQSLPAFKDNARFIYNDPWWKDFYNAQKQT